MNEEKPHKNGLIRAYVNRAQFRKKVRDSKHTTKVLKRQKTEDELKATRDRVQRKEDGEKARIATKRNEGQNE